MSADWMRKPATVASAQSIHLYSHETRLHQSLVKLPDYHLHVFSPAALCVWGIPPVGIQKAMSLSTSVPHLTIPYLLRGDAVLTPLTALLTNVLSHHHISLSRFCLSSSDDKIFLGAGSHVLLGRGQWGLWLCSYKLCMISKYSTVIFLAQSSYWSGPPE